MDFINLILFLLFVTIAIIVIVNLTRLANIWINRKKNKVDDDKFDRLAKAFVQFRKDAERRIENLEAIIASEHEPGIKNKQLMNDKPENETIEIEKEIVKSPQT